MIKVWTKINLQHENYMDSVTSIKDFLDALPKRSWTADFAKTNDTRVLCYELSFKNPEDAVAFRLRFECYE